MYLVDTSVWIDFLRGNSDPKIQFLESLLEDGSACMNGVIFAELCFGAQSPAQFKKYDNYFSQLPFLQLPENWHRSLARMGRVLRAKGVKPFVADLLIALTALEHRVPLLTKDSDFKPFQDLFGLELV